MRLLIFKDENKKCLLSNIYFIILLLTNLRSFYKIYLESIEKVVHYRDIISI